MKKFILDNLGLKIAAILLSIALWFYVASRGLSEMTLDMPLEFKNVPEGLEIVSHTVKTVSLSIKGQESLIKDIKSSEISVYVDLSKAKKGESIYYINKENVKLPHMVTVTNINPSYTRVMLDETVTKTVPVKPVIIGTPERGFYVKSIEVTPQTVVVEGIKSEVKRVNNIKTDPVDMTAVDETSVHTVKLSTTGMNIRTRTNEVKIRVVIAGSKK